MKKTIYVALLICLLLLQLVSCNSRREEIKNNQTNEAETSSVIESTPSFYEGMTTEDFLTLYDSNKITEKSHTPVINTPYYYIFTDGNTKGGQVFNKLTNSFEYLCKDPFCDHKECIFSWKNNYVAEEFVVHNNRIYVLVSSQAEILDSTQYCLYSMDLLLHDLSLVYEFPVTVEDQYVEGENGLQTSFGRNIRNLCFYDDAIYCSDFYIDSDNMISPTVYKLDLNTKEYSSFLEDTYADITSLKLYNHTLSWENIDKERVYYDLKINSYVEEYTGMQENLQFPEEYTVISWVICGESGYVMIDHTTEKFTEDPHYEYFRSEYIDDPMLTPLGSRDYPLRSGGELYKVVKNEGGQVVLESCVKMETDGIPDIIHWFCTDGKTALVKYETYMDFRNPYNPDYTVEGDSSIIDSMLGKPSIAPANYQYALIDLETGMIIRDIKPIAP